MLNLKDKIILVSKRMLDESGNESFDTFFGKVTSNDNEKILILNQHDKEVSIPPYDDELYDIAEEGFYELEDGSTYENPDYIVEFLVHSSQEA